MIDDLHDPTFSHRIMGVVSFGGGGDGSDGDEIQSGPTNADDTTTHIIDHTFQPGGPSCDGAGCHDGNPFIDDPYSQDEP